VDSRSLITFCAKSCSSAVEYAGSESDRHVSGCVYIIPFLTMIGFTFSEIFGHHASLFCLEISYSGHKILTFFRMNGVVYVKIKY